MSGPHPEEPASDTGPGVEEGAGAGGEGPAGGEPGRVRLVGVETERDASSGLSVTVELAWEESVHSAEARGVGTAQVELRLGAEATLEALCRFRDEPGFARMVGVKTVHAFDSEVVLVGVRCEAAPGRTLIGAAPVQGGDATRTAAAAVLDAVNRIMGSGRPG